MTGLPCSGKTHRAQQIASELQAYIASNPSLSQRSVQIIQSHHASLDPKNGPSSVGQERASENQPDQKPTLRDEIYNSASREKTARAEEFSAIKRALSKETIVIADGLNYIKGYRYQLWCEAKAAATRCCVVHVAAQEDECQNWNRERMRAWGIEVDEEDKQDTNKGVAGTNGFGDLAPESHTAIYGDRVVEKKKKPSRSRSSSMNHGSDSEDGNHRPRPPSQADDDNMTLKSLYIGNRTTPETTHSSRNARGTTDPATTSVQPVTLPSLPPPGGVISPPPSTSSPPYLASTLSSLIMRYEPPSPFSRWDTPLFTIPSTDAAIPTAQIWTALYPTPAAPTSKKALSQLASQQRQIPTRNNNDDNNNNKNDISSNRQSSPSSTTQSAPRPSSSTLNNNTTSSSTGVKQHAATILPQSSTADALQILESTTMDVVKQLLARAREVGLGDGGDGGDLTMTMTMTMTTTNPRPSAWTDTTSGDTGQNDMSITIHIPPALTLNQPLLQRLRRKYTQIQRAGIAHGQGYVQGRAAIVEGFVGFLDGEWNPDE